jgi:hypothetical protein
VWENPQIPFQVYASIPTVLIAAKDVVPELDRLYAAATASGTGGAAVTGAPSWFSKEVALRRTARSTADRLADVLESGAQGASGQIEKPPAEPPFRIFAAHMSTLLPKAAQNFTQGGMLWQSSLELDATPVEGSALGGWNCTISFTLADPSLTKIAALVLPRAVPISGGTVSAQNNKVVIDGLQISDDLLAKLLNK